MVSIVDDVDIDMFHHVGGTFPRREGVQNSNYGIYLSHTTPVLFLRGLLKLSVLPDRIAEPASRACGTFVRPYASPTRMSGPPIPASAGRDRTLR